LIIRGIPIPSHISVLGGGPAGLSIAYYAHKNGFPFSLYEASKRIGGNCVTFRHGDFLFDSGAHRFHDKDPEITGEVKLLLGDDLRVNNTPSQIYRRGKFIDFPLSPLNLLKNLGIFTCVKAGFELTKSRLKKLELDPSFESFAHRTYGKTIAGLFLLNYSEKLWGASAKQLSSYIAGTRMKGLDLRTFITEAIRGRYAKVQHLDGRFYYPRLGIGMIAEKLAQVCGQENIRLSSRITRISHDGSTIREIQINQEKTIPVDQLVSTLPLNLFLQMMDPLPPAELIQLSKSLRFRNLMLVGFFLNSERVSENASMYFPDPEFPFTRVYEPKRRSMDMSPPGSTSIIAEIPCYFSDSVWKMSDEQLKENVFEKLSLALKIRKDQLLDSVVIRIGNAYPILEKGFEEKVEAIFEYLQNFRNLKVAGRNGKFTYTSIHNMMRFGKEVVDEYQSHFRQTGAALNEQFTQASI
jgi:protoporphyrinogen oxidase